MLRPESEWQLAKTILQISRSTTTLPLSWNIRRGNLALFRTLEISIVFQLRNFSSTRLLCPSPTALLQGWMAFRPQILKDLAAKIIPFFCLLIFQGFVLYTDCFTVVIVFWGDCTHPNVVFLQLVRFQGWVVMKNNETCNAPKCLKPSGLIDWTNCRRCNGWVQIKCANLSRTEVRNLAEFKCSRWSLVNTIPQCQDDNFRRDTLFNSGVVHLKRVPNNSGVPLAEHLTPKINDICGTPSNFALWCLLLSSLSYFLEKPPRGGKRQRSSLSAIINKRIRDSVIEKKPKRDRKPQQKSELDRWLRSFCTKLDEGNVKAGIRMAVGDDTIADFTVDNYAALKLKHPQRETRSVPDPTDIDCFSTSEFFVHKALMSFPNGSSAGLNGISPQILKDLTAKSNGQTGLNFLRASTNLVNMILEGKVPFELRPYFFGAKLIALKKPDGELRPIAVGYTFRRLSAKCAGYHVFESRQARYGNWQVGVGTKRGAELASYVFPC